MYKAFRIALFSLFFGVAAIYWFQIGGDQTNLLRNTLFLVFSLLASAAGAFSLQQYGFKNQRTSVLLGLTLGMTGFFIGDVLFYLYEFVFHIDPFPSIADVFYLLAYPLFFYALVNELRQTHIAWRSIRPSIRFLLGGISFVIAILVAYFGVYLVIDPAQTLLANVIAMSYGLGDLGLIVADIAVLVLAWEFRHGRFSGLWIRLFLSFITMLLADILFALYSTQYSGEVWLYKSVIDTFFMLSYTFFADAMLYFGFTIWETRAKLKRK